jgi:hypothetical protein
MRHVLPIKISQTGTWPGPQGLSGRDPDSTGRCMQTRRNRAQLAMDACCSVGFGAIGVKIHSSGLRPRSQDFKA